MTRLPLLLLCLLSALALPGCGIQKQFSSERTAVAQYDANCLWALQQARDYAAQGRYELAKEQYLMALAACDTPDVRQIVTHELRSVDMMIKAQR